MWLDTWPGLITRLCFNLWLGHLVGMLVSIPIYVFVNWRIRRLDP